MSISECARRIAAAAVAAWRAGAEPDDPSRETIPPDWDNLVEIDAGEALGLARAAAARDGEAELAAVIQSLLLLRSRGEIDRVWPALTALLNCQTTEEKVH